nr:AAA family ATPase [Oceanobacter mangrovi]
MGPGCLIGEPGSGKSLLLDSLKQRLATEGHLVVVATEHSLVTQQILFEMAHQLGIGQTTGIGTDGLFELVANTLVALAPKRRMVLLLDDADQLSADAWSMIISLTMAERQGVRLFPSVLVSRQVLDSGDWLVQMRLGQYSLPECKAYVQTRLQHVGARSAIFTDQALERLYFYSAGIPEQINLICQQAMTTACWHGLAGVDEALLDSVASNMQVPTSVPYENEEDDDEEEPGWMERSMAWLTDHPKGARWVISGSVAALVVFAIYSYTANDSRLIVAPELMQSLDDQPAKKRDSLQIFESSSTAKPQPDKVVAKAADAAQQKEQSSETRSLAEGLIASLSEKVDNQAKAVKQTIASVTHSSQSAASQSPAAQSPAAQSRPSQPSEAQTQSAATQSTVSKPTAAVTSRPEPSMAAVMSGNTVIPFPIDGQSQGQWHSLALNRTVAQMAKTRYGAWNDSLKDILMAANPQIRNIDDIETGEKVHLPDITARTLLIRNEYGQYFFYYGSSAKHETALEIRSRLLKDGYQATIQTNGSRDRMWRVFAGPFKDKQEAWNSMAGMEIGFIPYLFG